MSERGEFISPIDPPNAEDYANDVDSQTLAEVSDASMRLNAIAQLERLEAKGIHVDAVVMELDNTFSGQTHELHEDYASLRNEGILEIGKLLESLIVKKQLAEAAINSEASSGISADAAVVFPLEPTQELTPTFGSQQIIPIRRNNSVRTNLSGGSLRGRNQGRGRTRPR